MIRSKVMRLGYGRVLYLAAAALALVLGSGALTVAGLSKPSSAAPSATVPGQLDATVAITPTSGNLTAAPMFTGGTVTGASCPEHFRNTNATTHVPGPMRAALVRSTGEANSLIFALDGVTYDQPSFTFTARSPGANFALGDAIQPTDPPAPKYEVRLLCLPDQGFDTGGLSTLDYPYYSLWITVNGDTWQLTDPPPPAAATSLDLTGDPAGQAVVNKKYKLVAKVTPSNVPGSVKFFTNNGITPIGNGAVPVQNGQASIELQAPAGPINPPYTATFLPADTSAFSPSSDALSYYVVDEPSIQVNEETAAGGVGNLIDADSTLTAGQKLKVSGKGFWINSSDPPVETAKVAISGSTAQLPDAAVGNKGEVTAAAVTVPSDLKTGCYTLSMTGSGSGVRLEFPFRVGDVSTCGTADPTPSPSATGDPSDDDGNNDGGDKDGGNNDNGNNDGGNNDGGNSGGANGGGGGGGGSLPRTGSALVPLVVGGVLLVAIGVVMLYRTRRWLDFDPIPQD